MVIAYGGLLQRGEIDPRQDALPKVARKNRGENIAVRSGNRVCTSPSKARSASPCRCLVEVAVTTALLGVLHGEHRHVRGRDAPIGPTAELSWQDEADLRRGEDLGLLGRLRQPSG